MVACQSGLSTYISLVALLIRENTTKPTNQALYMHTFPNKQDGPPPLLGWPGWWFHLLSYFYVLDFVGEA